MPGFAELGVEDISIFFYLLSLHGSKINVSPRDMCICMVYIYIYMKRRLAALGSFFMVRSESKHSHSMSSAD